MRLLETLQEYDFDIEYYPGARNYIQDALSRRSDYKKAPIPRISLGSKEKSPLPAPLALPLPPTPPCPPTSTEHTELLLASGIQADEWMSSLKQEYKACPYFSDVLIALGGGNQPEDDSETRRKL